MEYDDDDDKDDDDDDDDDDYPRPFFLWFPVPVSHDPRPFSLWAPLPHLHHHHHHHHDHHHHSVKFYERSNLCKKMTLTMSVIMIMNHDY